MVFWLSLIFLFFLPFLDGGTNFLAEVLILTLPLPLFLIGLSRNEFDFKSLPPFIILPWLAFIVFLLISVLTSNSLIFSIPAFFQTLAIFLWFCLFLLTSGYQFSGGPITVDSLKLVTGLILLVAAGLSLVSFYYLLPWAGQPPMGMNLVYASYGHNHLADVLLLAIPLALALFLQAKERRRELLLSLLILLYIVALVLTFSRGAFLVLPPVVLFLLFLAKPRLVSQKLLSWLLILLPIGLIGLIGVFSLSKTGLEAKLAQPGNWLVRQLVKPEFQAKRVEYWREAVEGFAAKPLTGFGWGTFELVGLRFQRATAGWSSYTHNFYLQVLAEAGIFAFLAFLSFLFLAIRQIWKQIPGIPGIPGIKVRDPFLLGGFGAILASSLHSLLDFDWHFPAVFLLFLLIIASLIGKAKGVRGAHPPLADRGDLSAPIFRYSLLFLAIIVFLFGQLEVLSEYFEQKGDIKTALLLSPWPVVRVRDLGNRVLVNEPDGEKFMESLSWVWGQDPGMNLWLGNKNYEKGEVARAVAFYEITVENNPIGNFGLYPKMGVFYRQQWRKHKRDRIYQFFARNLERAGTKENQSIAKTLYFIGQDYLQDGRKSKTLSWWRQAADWSPNWSYFYIEAASLAIEIKKVEVARAILDKCLTYEAPRAHCQDFKKRLTFGWDFTPPGYWQEKIREIPDY